MMECTQGGVCTRWRHMDTHGRTTEETYTEGVNT